MLNDKDDHAGQGAAALGLFEEIVDSWEFEGCLLIGLSVRVPQEEGDEYLLVIRVEKDGVRYVSFRSAETMLSLWISFVRALKFRNIKLKEDKYEYGNS